MEALFDQPAHPHLDFTYDLQDVRLPPFLNHLLVTHSLLAVVQEASQRHTWRESLVRTGVCARAEAVLRRHGAVAFDTPLLMPKVRLRLVIMSGRSLCHSSVADTAARTRHRCWRGDRTWRHCWTATGVW
jgi:hypothetical protein